VSDHTNHAKLAKNAQNINNDNDNAQSNYVLLRVENLTKKYDKEVLRVEDLTIEKGKIYGIIGPSGAGKSTFLRIVNLLEPPTTGNISFNGHFVSINSGDAFTAQREMTLMFQKPTLFRTSVFENVAYGLKARKYDRDTIQVRVSELLQKIGLADFARRQATSLSGGEAQRVALARALAFKPKLLLLDEPTANLDPTNIEVIENLIQEMNRETEVTVIIVTHNIFQAKRIAHQVIFIHDGRIVEAGPTEKIFTEPEDPRTKAFVEGRMVY